MKPSNENRTYNTSLLTTLRTFSLCGLAAFGLLAAVEWIDTSLRLAGLFESPLERLAFTAYYGIDLLVGAGVGLAVGACAYLGWVLGSAIRRLLGPRVRWRAIQTLAVWTAVSVLTSLVLNQIGIVHAYVIGMIREAEKSATFRDILLNHERTSSYLLLIAFAVGCGLIVAGVRLVGNLNRFWLALWCLSLLILMLGAYYVDSRVQLQLYEYTMHRSLFLFEVIVAMTLVGSIFASRRGDTGQSDSQPNARLRTALVTAGLLVLIAAAGFSFARFDSNQSLETAAFYQTTQMKQSFRLARWALDFDRDGYSSVLGGGDTADTDARINPGQVEVPADGIDNNCIGGDLTQTAVDEWTMMQRGAAQTSVTRSPARLNIVYFFIDALRADHLGAYGYSRPTSPNLDRLAAKSQVFENAFTPSPRTAAALPKFMQSSYWDARVESWTQVLSRNQYDTMLFPGRRSWERYKQWMKVAPRAQGKPLKENIDVAIETIEGLGQYQPFCAYIYVPDPHKPYIPHDDHSFGTSVVDLYDGEIAYTDFYIGKFLDWLERAGRMKDTMIVIMSDHGESLGERGVYLHATQLYNEQARVPLIVYLPGYTPRRIPDYVTTVDLGSTILDLAGINRPETYVGVSLTPLMRGEPFVHPPIYGEQTGEEISQYVRFDQQVHPETKKYMVITPDGFKLIYNRDFSTFELYDLRNDPLEAHNLYDRLPDRARETRQLLGRFIDVLSVSRPRDADEGRYSRTGETDGDKVEE